MSAVTTSRIIIICYLSFTIFCWKFENVCDRIKCPLYSVTGIPCAGCGATRAVKSLYQGKILDAIRYNFLAVTAFPLLILSLFSNKFIKMLDTKPISTLLIITVIIFFGIRFIQHI